MARFRSIDPEFWRQPQLANLPFLTRLVLLGLLSQADDQGRVTANSVQLQGILFTFGKRPTPAAITAALAELSTIGEIHLYEGTDHRDYCVLRGWKNAASWQYQVIQRPQAARCPEPVAPFPAGVQPDVPRRPVKPEKTSSDAAPKTRQRERSSNAR